MWDCSLCLLTVQGVIVTTQRSNVLLCMVGLIVHACMVMWKCFKHGTSLCGLQNNTLVTAISQTPQSVHVQQNTTTVPSPGREATPLLQALPQFSVIKLGRCPGAKTEGSLTTENCSMNKYILTHFFELPSSSTSLGTMPLLYSKENMYTCSNTTTPTQHACR